MSVKQLNNLYNESVAGRNYQYNRETLLLELTINDTSIKKFAAKYLEYVIELDFSTAEHSNYASNPYTLDNMLLTFCKERHISLNYQQVAASVLDPERIKSRKYKTTFKNFAHLVGDIFWREQKAASRELAEYLLALDNIEPNIWGAPEDDGIGINLSDEFNSALGSNNSMWIFLPMQHDKTKMRIRFRFDCSDTYHMIGSIMKLFNKRQQMLPNKDIFGYANFTELVKTLATTRSKSELKQVGANFENTIKEIKAAMVPCENKNWVVIKPPNHIFSKKYFGFTRYSIRNILAIADRAEKDPANRDEILGEISTMNKVRGATWCTAANKDEHWKQYVVNDKNEMYYFINLQAEPDKELYAMRTLGSYKNLAKAYNGPITEKQLQDLGVQMNQELGPAYKKGAHFTQSSTIPKGIPPGVHGIWARLTPLDNTTVMLNSLYYSFPSSYTHLAIIEVRDQKNSMVESHTILDALGEEWALKNINFISDIPSMSEGEATKTALDMCMKKKEASSNQVNSELVKKFKLK